MNHLKALYGALRWRLNHGTTLADEQADSGQVQGLLVTCLHPQGCWSYCTRGYRYCLCCMKVRVRC